MIAHRWAAVGTFIGPTGAGLSIARIFATRKAAEADIADWQLACGPPPAGLSVTYSVELVPEHPAANARAN
jgi:hypothetical protein